MKLLLQVLILRRLLAGMILMMLMVYLSEKCSVADGPSTILIKLYKFVSEGKNKETSSDKTVIVSLPKDSIQNDIIVISTPTKWDPSGIATATIQRYEPVGGKLEGEPIVLNTTPNPPSWKTTIPNNLPILANGRKYQFRIEQTVMVNGFPQITEDSDMILIQNE